MTFGIFGVHPAPGKRYVELVIRWHDSEVRLPDKRPVGDALAIATGLVAGAGPAGPPVPALVELARRFFATQFDVPAGQDADGLLFQYGKAGWLSSPTLVVGMVRQLEVLDAAGAHEAYSQVQLEYRYDLDRDLESAGGFSEWWFPDDGTPLESWLDTVSRSPIGDLLASREPREFLVWHDRV
ncbi:hypothetical protein AB0878_41310 [Amycolatopsis sp. NPDC047767]|uniref:hypothetical protein n=1 Tax=Amycolatopsis sp. NPDC047767 TaxID=3156765 RepID=UPI00345451F3